MRESLPWQQQELLLSYCQPLLISCGTLTVTHEYSFPYLVNNVCVCCVCSGCRSPEPETCWTLGSSWLSAVTLTPTPTAVPWCVHQRTVARWVPLICSLSPFSANRHAPGLRQHEDDHVGGSGRSHHQRSLRPRPLWHARVAGGRQARRLAHPQRQSVTSYTNVTTRVQKWFYSVKVPTTTEYRDSVPGFQNWPS